MRFIHFTEEQVHAHLLASIVTGNLDLADDAPATSVLDYLVSKCPYDTLHFLANLDDWF